jgi:hypothetical protein
LCHGHVTRRGGLCHGHVTRRGGLCHGHVTRRGGLCHGHVTRKTKYVKVIQMALLQFISEPTGNQSIKETSNQDRDLYQKIATVLCPEQQCLIPIWWCQPLCVVVIFLVLMGFYLKACFVVLVYSL